MSVHTAQLVAAVLRTLADGAVEPERAARINRYVELVETWNARVDLTAAKTPEARVEVLVADACVLARPGIIPVGAQIADVGTGAGAPIVPLVLLRDDVRARCIEPRRKRVAFLRTVIGQLGLVSRLAVDEAQIDPAAPRLQGDAEADFACSRATFAPPRWLEIALALAPRAAVFVAREPLPPPPPGAQLIAQHDYALPWSKAPRSLGIYARG